MLNEQLGPDDLSAGAAALSLCPGCRIPWTPTAWFVDDSRFRKDLIGEIGKGTLHEFSCDSCGVSVRANVPLLVIREQAPQLVFSPAPGTTSIDDHNQLVSALQNVQTALSSSWSNELLLDISIVARSLLPNELGMRPGASHHAPGVLVEAWIEADTDWKKQYVLAAHPALFEQEAATEVEQLIAAAAQVADRPRLQSLRRLQGMLASCVHEGPQSFQRHLPSLLAYDPSDPINELLLHSAAALHSGRTDLAIRGLSETSRFLASEDNPLLWANVLGTIVETGSLSDPRFGEIVIEACNTLAPAVFACGPWLACLAEAQTRAGDCLWASRQSSADEEKAIQLYDAAARAYQILGDEWGLLCAYDALGFLHYQRQDGSRAQHLEAALGAFLEGAKHVQRQNDSGNWAAMQFNVGNAYLERLAGDPKDNLRRAIDHLTQAADAQSKLADKVRLDHTLDRLRLAQELAFRTYLSADPRSADLSRAIAALAAADWQGAVDGYQSAISQTEKMLESAHVEEARREVFGDFGTAYAASAYALLRLGRIEDAIRTLEAGRCRILSEEMDSFDFTADAIPAALRERLTEARQRLRLLRTTKFISRHDITKDPAEKINRNVWEDVNRNVWEDLVTVLDEIRETAPEALSGGIGERELLGLAPIGGAIIAPVFSIVGCCVIIARHGQNSIAETDLLWLDRFTDNDLIALLTEWSELQQRGNRGQRRDAITAFCARLWQVFAEPVAGRLDALGVQRGATILILPQGGLGALPLHAAGDDSSARCLLDSYVVASVPSAFMLATMQSRVVKLGGDKDSILCVADPLGDLDYGRAEGVAAARAFPSVSVKLLAGQDANSLNLPSAAVGQRYLHLSCHAYFTVDGGNYSGLHLATDRAALFNEELAASFEGRPALTDLFIAGQRWIVHNLDLAACRLVTLSACESGRVDVRNPDEFVGLPSAFLRAGAAEVIATLWRVDDVATMLLVGKLYERIIVARERPAAALRSAQLWMRDATNWSLLEIYQAMRDSPDKALSAYHVERELRRHALARPDDRPYSSPYYWAAFVAFSCG